MFIFSLNVLCFSRDVVPIIHAAFSVVMWFRIMSHVTERSSTLHLLFNLAYFLCFSMEGMMPVHPVEFNSTD